MDARVILDKLSNLGITMVKNGDKLRFEPGSRVPDDLVSEIRQHKAELLACLNRKPLLGDELERVLELGARRKRGEISALRCGITGHRCTSCQGVPCLGSEPWDDSE